MRYTGGMLAKKQLELVLGKITTGGLTVTYWDGETKQYGPESWVHITFTDERVVKQLRKNLELGVGEGYMDGLIEVDGDLAQIGRLGDANRAALAEFAPKFLRKSLAARNKNRQQESANVQHHYDLGNDFYALWLDRTMTYSCAYFTKDTDTLEIAQRHKVANILQKLNLKRGMSLLDIGSGWGELIIAAAKQYGVRSHGITVSEEQYKKTRERIKAEGLDGQVSVSLQHYDELPSQQYDRVVSVGMYEHVGADQHHRYMAAVERSLAVGGWSLLHTITQWQQRPTSPWIDRYIFPGGYLPTLESTFSLLPDYDFHAIDYESRRLHYARTLNEWWKRFENHLPEITEMYDERFVRMWRLYLRGSYAAFRWGNLDLAQIIWTKGLSNDVPLTRAYQTRT